MIPTNPSEQTCFFCGHRSIDVPPGYDEQTIAQKNKRIAEEHRQRMITFAEEQAVPGATRSRAPTMPKGAESIGVCHCHQMQCESASGIGTCITCRDTPGEIDAEGFCSCEVCRCQCKKAYKVSIHWQLAVFIRFLTVL